MEELEEDMTLEEAEAKIMAGNKGFRSLGKDRCAYRGADNNKCAIGCFIPDHLYNELMDSCNDNSIRAILPRFPELLPYMPFEDIELLVSFQYQHDSNPYNIQRDNNGEIKDVAIIDVDPRPLLIAFLEKHQAEINPQALVAES